MRGFLPLPDEYYENLSSHGYLYSFDDAETLNYLHYSCPKCGCTDRDRLYALYLDLMLRNERHLKILDVAPSKSLEERLRRDCRTDVRTIDLFMENVDDRLSLTDLNLYANDSFDFFICSHVLEHIPEDMKALKELYRVLRVGGGGILMVPIVLSLGEIDEDPMADEAERWRRFGQGDHVRMYSKSGFIQRVEAAGLTVRQLREDDFPRGAFSRSGISPTSVLYVVQKRG